MVNAPRPGTTILYCRVPGYGLTPLPVYCYEPESARMVLDTAEVLRIAFVMAGGEILQLEKVDRVQRSTYRD